MGNDFFENKAGSKAMKRLYDSITGAPTPQEITLFAKTAPSYEHHERHSFNFGEFTSVLIGNSYRAGHNDFLLQMPGISQRNLVLCYNLKGKPGKPIIITIEGDLRHDGISIGSHCSYV